jgi:FKBP-type peptidyl-prolyl cis-trans isomerase 2
MLKKKDFIELEFTARIKEGEIFDTNIKEKAKKLGIDEAKPLRICMGENMILKGFDEALAGKEIGKEYEVELPPEKAFGFRDSKLVKIIPISVFTEKNVSPQAGMLFDFDGIIAKISSVSGGRVLVDFNNPLSGKNVVYQFKVLKKIEDKEEELKILSEFYLGTDKFEPKEGKFLFKGNFQKKAFEEFSKKAKEILGIDVEHEK